MDKPKVNFIAVILAAAAMWILGAVWYSLFSSSWMEYTGVTEEMAMNMSGGAIAMAYGGSLLAYIVTFYVMAHFIHYTNSSDIGGGLQTGFWLWLGFVATSMFVANTYSMKPFGLFILDSLYWLLGLLIGGVILAKMKKK